MTALRPITAWFGIGALALLLAGCDILPDWFGKPEGPPLPGARLSVISLDKTLEPDPEIADLAVRLPPPYVNRAWPQVGGYPDRAMHHLSAGDALAEQWRVSIGDGSDDDGHILSPPVVGDGRIFAMDSEILISAYDVASGDQLWETDPIPEEDDEGGFGGGLAYARGWIFATTGFGEVLALDAATGAIQWRQTIGIPMRAPPVVTGDRLFTVSYDNQLWALNALDGSVLWSHTGIAETAGLLGNASPAVEGEVVIAPYSSGELTALRVENGRTVWADTLAFQRVGIEALAALNDINGSPVIDRGIVFAIGHGGRLVAIDLRTGGRVWEKDIAGLNTPWVAGDFLFVVTVDGDVLCIARRNGRIRWVTSLPRFEDEEDRQDPIYWSGPILISDRLIVVGSDGTAWSLSPYDGRYLGYRDLPDGVRLAPVIANETLFILTDEADLVALR
jgi:outer membrane protein assembly factor BamB